jgi:hypothetical protein
MLFHEASFVKGIGGTQHGRSEPPSNRRLCSWSGIPKLGMGQQAAETINALGSRNPQITFTILIEPRTQSPEKLLLLYASDETHG